MSAFSTAAIPLVRAGYSPVPIRDGSKRPLMDGWDRLRATPMAESDIADLARRWPPLGLGVAGGYAGLVPIDVDTEDPAIIDAVSGALPRPSVAKSGKRGFTAFYWSAKPLAARRLKTQDQLMLVEVLTTGQTVIPPTIHPETKTPYRWLTARTLFDTAISQLPEVRPEILAGLERALTPWLLKGRENLAQPSCGSSRTGPMRMQVYARAALTSEARALWGKPKGSGRNWELFRAGARLGKFVHHGVIGLDEIEGALLAACEANGLIEEDGLRAWPQHAGKRPAQSTAQRALPMLGSRVLMGARLF